MTRSDLDAAARELLKKDREGSASGCWARRWVYGIDRTLATARKSANWLTPFGLLAEAATVYLEAEALPADHFDRERKLGEAERLMHLAMGA